MNTTLTCIAAIKNEYFLINNKQYFYISWYLILRTKVNKLHDHQCQAQIEIWPSPDFQLTFTWPPYHHLTFPRPLPNLIRRFYTSPEIHLTLNIKQIMTYLRLSPDTLHVDTLFICFYCSDRRPRRYNAGVCPALNGFFLSQRVF